MAQKASDGSALSGAATRNVVNSRPSYDDGEFDFMPVLFNATIDARF